MVLFVCLESGLSAFGIPRAKQCASRLKSMLLQFISRGKTHVKVKAHLMCEVYFFFGENGVTMERWSFPLRFYGLFTRYLIFVGEIINFE